MSSPQEVFSFIRATFRSVWSLELLCFLNRDRETSFSHAEMVAGLRGSDIIVRQSINELFAAGLVSLEEDGRARFRPASEDLEQLARATEELYAKSPDAVRRSIVSATNPSISAFADAFKVRRD